MSEPSKYGLMIPRILAGFGVCMSILILLFWYIHFNDLITVKQSYMLIISYKGALCFLLANLALLNASWWRQPYLTQVCAILLILLSGAFFLDRFLHIPNPITALFTTADTTVDPIITPKPRNFVPVSLLFVLTGFTLLLTQRKKNPPILLWFMLISTLTVFMFAFASLLAYLLQLSFTYHWGVFPIRPSIALGLLLLSSGLYVHCYYYIKGQIHFFFACHEPKIVFTTCAFIITILWLALRIHAQLENNDPTFSFFSTTDLALFHHILWGLAIILAWFAAKSLALVYALSHRSKELYRIESILYTAEHIAKLGTWVWEVNNEHIWCTPEIWQILECPQVNHTLAAPLFFSYFTPKTQTDLKNKLALLTPAQPHLKALYTIHTEKGRSKMVTIEAQLSRFEGTNPIEITGTLQDITEKKKLEQQLIQIQKIETVAQLAGGIAHDFNNLLMVIRGNLELLSMSITDPKLTKFITASHKATDHGAALTKQLLGFSRKQLLTPQAISIPAFLKNFNLLLQSLIPANIQVTLQVPDTLWQIWVDASQLENALLNLAVNAKDAMPRGGKLFFGFENYAQPETDTNHDSKLPAGEYVQIEVIDTGTGMSPEVLERAFEAFFTTKDIGKGTGLGLAMVHGFAKQSKGLVTLYSEPGHGTTAKLYLPRAKVTESIPEVVPQAFPPITATLLVVEDEAALREITATYLTQAGFTVLEASDGPSALKTLQTHPEIDLLLCDMMMPGGMTGADVAIAARQAHPDLKIILVSGYAPNTIDLSLYPDPKPEVVSKPYIMEDLIQKLRHLLKSPD